MASWSRVVLLVIGTLVSNNFNELYCMDPHNTQTQGFDPTQNAAQATAAGLAQGANAAMNAAQQGHPQAVGQPGFQQQGFQQQNFVPQGFTPPGFPPQGFPQMMGAAPQGFPQMMGAAPQGFPQMMGAAPQGFPQMGVAPQGYSQMGAMPNYPPTGTMPGYGMGFQMFGVNLAKPLVAETLDAISRVAELSVSALNLPNRDIKSLSDPFCITYLRPFNAQIQDSWIEYHKSETVMDNLSPEFAGKPLIPPSFGDKYSIMFKLFDSDPTSKKHDPLGYVEFNLKELLSKNKMTQDLRTTKRTSSREIVSRSSSVTVRVEHLIDDNDEYRMEMNGSEIEKKDRSIIGTRKNSDPFVEISKRIGESNEFSVVYRTETKENEVTPVWVQFNVSLKGLINGDENRMLKFTCYDWDKKGRELIGDFQLTFAQLRDKVNYGELMHFHNLESKRANKIAGNLRMVKFERIHHPTFTAFIRRGLKFHLNIAIDFSDANGGLQLATSLHARTPNPPGSMNKYQQALNSVLTILEDYDFDKSFPTYGFAARNSKTAPASDAFQLNPDAPNCAGLFGVMEAYLKFINKPETTLARPVKFAPVLRKIVQSIKTPPPSQDDFYIIVIFTAGEISDIPDTEMVIKEASTLPISIIIVGVGDATGTRFANMERLDGDHLQKTLTGARAPRDIVQFVPLSKYVTSYVDSSASLILAKELLAELPDQVITYMKMRSFQPRDVMMPQMPQQYPQMGGYSNAMGGMTMPQLQNLMGFYPQAQAFSPAGYAATPMNYMNQNPMAANLQAQNMQQNLPSQTMPQNLQTQTMHQNLPPTGSHMQPH